MILENSLAPKTSDAELGSLHSLDMSMLIDYCQSSYYRVVQRRQGNYVNKIFWVSELTIHRLTLK